MISIAISSIPRVLDIEKVYITILLSILWIGISILVGWNLSKIMQSKGIKTNHLFIIAISCLSSILLWVKYGLSVTAIQGLFLLFVLIYASCSDLTDHTVDDSTWLIILSLSLVNIETLGLVTMTLGAVCVFIPQISMALLPPHKTLGGADIKLSTALAFLLGGWRGMGAYLIGLVVAVIVMSIYNKCTNRCKKKPFALVPFLSFGAMLMFLI